MAMEFFEQVRLCHLCNWSPFEQALDTLDTSAQPAQQGWRQRGTCQCTRRGIVAARGSGSLAQTTAPSSAAECTSTWLDPLPVLCRGASRQRPTSSEWWRRTGRVSLHFILCSHPGLAQWHGHAWSTVLVASRCCRWCLKRGSRVQARTAGAPGADKAAVGLCTSLVPLQASTTTTRIVQSPRHCSQFV